MICFSWFSTYLMVVGLALYLYFQNLYKKQLSDVRLQESIGEALGAVVYTYCQIDNNCQKSVSDTSVK